jgi:hypothetical protein
VRSMPPPPPPLPHGCGSHLLADAHACHGVEDGRSRLLWEAGGGLAVRLRFQRDPRFHQHTHTHTPACAGPGAAADLELFGQHCVYVLVPVFFIHNATHAQGVVPDGVADLYGKTVGDSLSQWGAQRRPVFLPSRSDALTQRQRAGPGWYPRLLDRQ